MFETKSKFLNDESPNFFFFMLVLLVEYIFLTTFFGLYFNHQLHTTIAISLSSYLNNTVVRLHVALDRSATTAGWIIYLF